MKYISPERYKDIHDNMPIPCVDIVILHAGKILLHKRSNKPAQGQWWFPGGRVQKGETLAECARRKIHEETGLTPTKLVQLNVDETLFPDGPFEESTHTINIIFYAEVADIDTLTLDEQSTEYHWATKVAATWHPYVRTWFEKARELAPVE